MIYLSIEKNNIKLLALSKAILGQYNASFFQKKHESSLLEKGRVMNIDLLASAIKEAITLSSAKELKDKEVTLMLPQDSFDFRRIDVPFDISESAILPFIKDKVRAELSYDIESSLYDYVLTKQGTESKVLFFAMSPESFTTFNEVFKLLGLSIKSIIPDTFAYFKLFEKTLKKDKKENILYVNYEDQNSFGYLYDSLGLLNGERFEFQEPIEPTLKTKVDELQTPTFKLNRIILSGTKSDTVRQDFFTKDVGVWTNPLKKIISNFYTEYLKMIVLPPDTTFSYIDYAVTIGGFIFSRENESFNMFKKNSGVVKRAQSNRSSSPRSFKLFQARDLLIFLISFIVSFALIYSVPKLLKYTQSNVKFALKPTPTTTPTPKVPTATPTPEISKENLKIQVLNGGGTAGVATKVKNILKEKGYSDIVTDNADNFDYTKTIIRVKDSVKDAANTLKDDLKDYTTTVTIETLKASETPDMVLVVGSDFK